MQLQQGPRPFGTTSSSAIIEAARVRLTRRATLESEMVRLERDIASLETGQIGLRQDLLLAKDAVDQAQTGLGTVWRKLTGDYVPYLEHRIAQYEKALDEYRRCEMQIQQLYQEREATRRLMRDEETADADLERLILEDSRHRGLPGAETEDIQALLENLQDIRRVRGQLDQVIELGDLFLTRLHTWVQAVSDCHSPEQFLQLAQRKADMEKIRDELRQGFANLGHEFKSSWGQFPMLKPSAHSGRAADRAKQREASSAAVADAHYAITEVGSQLKSFQAKRLQVVSQFESLLRDRQRLLGF